MPPPKNQLHVAQLDAHGGPIRRLSSIPSLQTLNPFHRRRSENAVVASSSSVNLQSTSKRTVSESRDDIRTRPPEQNPPRLAPITPSPTYDETLTEHDRISEMGDNVTGELPKSRTFSNLPLPSKNRRPSAEPPPSRSRIRLPSALASKTRLPSPRLSTRKHSATQSKTPDVNASTRRHRAQRSDTVPLLQSDDAQARRGPSQAPQKHRTRRQCTNASGSTERLLEDNTLSLPVSKYALPSSRGSSNTTTQADRGLSFSQSTKHRPPTSEKATKSGFVPRWQSQPNLTGSSSNRPSHGLIKESRLMSTLPVPNPSPPKPDLTIPLPPSSGIRKTSIPEENESSSLLGPSAEYMHAGASTSSHYTLPATTPSSSANPYSPAPTGIQVTTAEPSAYWAGRFSSLNDRYRNEELAAFLRNSPPLPASSPPSSSTSSLASNPFRSVPRRLCLPDRSQALEDSIPRMRRALETLFTSCATDEARVSFTRWQTELAVSMDEPELAKPLKGQKSWGKKKFTVVQGETTAATNVADMSAPLTEHDDMVGVEGDEVGLLREHRVHQAGGSGTSSSGKKKTKFMDRLLGKNRKGLPMK